MKYISLTDVVHLAKDDSSVVLCSQTAAALSSFTLNHIQCAGHVTGHPSQPVPVTALSLGMGPGSSELIDKHFPFVTPNSLSRLHVVRVNPHEHAYLRKLVVDQTESLKDLLVWFNCLRDGECLLLSNRNICF